MMRRTLLATVLCVPLLLAGCGTTGSIDPARINDIIEQVRSKVAEQCQFLPDATNLALIINAFYAPSVPVTTLIVTVSNAICQGVAPKSIARGQITTLFVRTPVGQVPVTGKKL